MARLTSREFKKLQDCILAIYSHLDVHSFPAHIIQTTSNLIPSAVTSYAKIGKQNKKILYGGIASCRKWDFLEAFPRHMHEHPILNFLHPESLKPHCYSEDIEKAMQKRHPALRQFPHHRAAKISDALGKSRFQALSLFNEFFRRNEVEHQLLISFLPTKHDYSMISFNRDKRDFSEEERLLLNLLAPHIAQAYQNAEAREKARQAWAPFGNAHQSTSAHGLTNREEDVLYWVAQGKTNGETARILNIAPGTVKIHLEKIYQKLGVENRTSASAIARGRPNGKKEKV